MVYAYMHVLRVRASEQIQINYSSMNFSLVIFRKQIEHNIFQATSSEGK